MDPRRGEAGRSGGLGSQQSGRFGRGASEGELSAIRWLIDKMAYGPSGARVDNVEVRDVEPEGRSSFKVQH
jgi:hypothetical protein